MPTEFDSQETAAYDGQSDSSRAVGSSTFENTRFRILRPHAKGGLGEVWVAKDVELNREVALKEIQPQFANDARSRSRFLLEAEVTGALEHPGIVPVYGMRQYADGRPFYAMRFIQGNTPTRAACCTATSSRATSCSGSSVRRLSSTGDWPNTKIAIATKLRKQQAHSNAIRHCKPIAKHPRRSLKPEQLSARRPSCLQSRLLAVWIRWGPPPM
jgi:hypothetical protein